MENYSFDVMEIVVRILKYLFEGLVVATAAFFFPGKKPNVEEVMFIGFVAAATFSLLDLFSPSIGVRPHSSNVGGFNKYNAVFT